MSGNRCCLNDSRCTDDLLSLHVCAELLDDLLTEVFGADIGSLGRNIISRGILTPKNVDVDLINSKALARFPGQVRIKF